MGYLYDAIQQSEVYEKVSDMFFSGVFRRLGPKQVFPFFFGIKRTFQEKNHTTFLGLLIGISGQKMKDFDFSSCATPRSILVDIRSYFVHACTFPFRQCIPCRIHMESYTLLPLVSLTCSRGSTASLGPTNCDLSVVSDLNTHRMPCCCRQRRSGSDNPLMYGRTGVETSRSISMWQSWDKRLTKPFIPRINLRELVNEAKQRLSMQRERFYYFKVLRCPFLRSFYHYVHDFLIFQNLY